MTLDDTTEPDPGKPKAVVLLSGGLDSATCLAIAKAEGFEPFALTLRYGQRHQAEIASARRVAEAGGAAGHDIMDIDLAAFGGSALTGGMEVPKDRDPAAMGDGIPVTYVPARNTVFLALALARAETLGAFDIYIGVNALDYSGYPDCRPEYIAAFEALANLATRAGVEAAAKGSPRMTIHVPLIEQSKAEIVRRGVELGVDFAPTMSCYDPV
ncbi:MAG: 7-cyano-7-deazaguanine synthase QueC, partial [Proteobacteria bacterium]|nr:7-cyano-7-deazaguanine synthase QueC [Pseudomonadota bacterium]